MSASGEFRGMIGRVARELLGEPNEDLSSDKELRFGTNGSVRVTLDDDVFFDFERKAGGGVLDLISRETGCTNGGAVKWLRDHGFAVGSTERKQKKIEATYDYADEDGKMLFQVVRFVFLDDHGQLAISNDGKVEKTFAQRRRARPDDDPAKVKDGWVWSVKGARLVPYRLPELLEALALDRPVFIVEGEKKVDRLASIGVPSTCNPMGAGNWPIDFRDFFKGADVVVLPDMDPQAKGPDGKLRFHPDGRPVLPGQDHAREVANTLLPVARRLRYLELPDLPPKGDIIDWLDAGGTADSLNDLVGQLARPWAPIEQTESGVAALAQAAGIRATPFRWIDPARMPRREWLYGYHYIRRFLSATVAPGGVGKSTLELAELISMASGRSLLGVPVRNGPLRVWYWNGEDPIEEVQRRVLALCLHYKITPSEIEGRLFLDSGRNTPIVVATEARSGGIQIAEPVVSALKATIRENKIDVLSIDPFIASHSVSENDNNHIARIAEQYASIADATGCSVELVHHVRKNLGGQDVEFTVDDARGATALIAAARSARVLNTMQKAEATKASIEKRRDYFRVDDGKQNLAPPPEKSAWFRKVGVPLGNGSGGLSDDQDYVAVVVQWEWPDSLDGVTAADLLKVQEAIDGKCLRQNIQAKDWIGHTVAAVLELDGKEDRLRISSMLKIWIESGALVVSEVKDAKGNTRPVIEVGTWAR